MPEIVLIRPGCTDFDEQNRIQGALDLPLNSRGRQQLGCLVDQLSKFRLEVIFTAPGEPAKSTACAIGEALDIPVKEKKALSNLNQGLWQGLQIDEIRRKYPKVYKQWQESPETICPPEGEPIAEAVKRIRKVLQKPLKKKVAFGIVASEPLATLICCVVEGRKPEMPETFGGNGNGQFIELLDASGKPADENSVGDSRQRHKTATIAGSETSARGGDAR